MMGRVVANVPLNSGRAKEICKLGEESVDRSTANGFEAGGQRIGGLGTCRQRHDAVQQAVVSTFY
jgi:hypothetical protein